MIFIKHRVNSISDLKKTNTEFGVEIDLRSEKNNIYLHHDPFKKGESFERWIKKFKHRIIVLNVKEEGLEKKIIKILNKNKIKNFFFHDQTFSTVIKNKSKTKDSVRYSEFEDLKKTNQLFKKIRWLWIDNFTNLKIDKRFFHLLKKMKVNICIVSPELVNKKRENEIKKIHNYLLKNKTYPNAVCTKKPQVWKKLYHLSFKS